MAHIVPPDSALVYHCLPFVCMLRAESDISQNCLEDFERIEGFPDKKHIVADWASVRELPYVYMKFAGSEDESKSAIHRFRRAEHT